MISRTFQTPEGEVTRELTNDEYTEALRMRDNDVTKEKLVTDIGKATSLQEEVDAIKEYLGV